MTKNILNEVTTIGIKPGTATVAAGAADRWGRKAYELDPIKNLDPTQNANIIDALKGNISPDKLTQADWDAIPSYDEAHAVAQKLGLKQFTYQVGGNPKNMSGIYGLGGNTPIPPGPTPPGPVPPVPPGPKPPIIPIPPEYAILGLIAAAGIIALIKKLNSTIKVRFRKCCKVLYKMQQDFVSENGLSMSRLMPGIGSKLMDLYAWFKGPKGKRKNRGTIGIVPFVESNTEEINRDYIDAVNAFNSIAIAGKSTPTVKKESNEIIYKSFAHALNVKSINEGIEKSSEVTSVDKFIDPKNIYANGGNFQITTSDGQVKTIQVTKESTREVCCAIINQFLMKYVDTKAMYQKLNLMTLGEIDNSNVAKFEKLLTAYKVPGDSGKSRQYARLEKDYNTTVDNYIDIGNRLINNFEKFTKNRKGDPNKASIDNKNLSEKDDMLLFTGIKKLKDCWSKQESYFKANFGKVLVAITSSKEYQQYINFILEKVMPVFKTGLAGDADPVLDIVPKVGELYFVRQSQQNNKMEAGKPNEGNVALVKVTAFDFNKQRISFELIGKVNGNIVASNKVKGTYEAANPKDIDYNAYKDQKGPEGKNRIINGKDGQGIAYQTWLSLDPYQATDVQEIESNNVPTTFVYKRTVEDPNDANKKRIEYVFAQGDQREFEKHLNPSEQSENTEVKQESTTAPTTFEADQPLDEGIKDTASKWLNSIKNFFKGKDKEEVEQAVEEHPEIMELDPNDAAATQFHVDDIYIGTIDDNSNLTDDIKKNMFSGAWVRLGQTCTFAEFDKIMKDAGFTAEKENGEKKPIKDQVNAQKGYTFTNDKIENAAKTPQKTDEVAFRKTTGENIEFNAEKLAADIINVVKSKQIQFPKDFIWTKQGGGYGEYGYSYVYKKDANQQANQQSDQQAQHPANPTNQPSNNATPTQPAGAPVPSTTQPTTLPKEVKTESLQEADTATPSQMPATDSNHSLVVNTPDDKNAIYIPIQTSIKDANTGGSFTVYVYPVILGQDGNPVKQQIQPNANVTVSYIMTLSNHSDNKNNVDVKKKFLDINNVQKTAAALVELKNEMLKTKELEPGRGDTEGYGVQKENIKIEYCDLFSLAESFASMFMPGANYLKVYRKIDMPKSDRSFYALSENAWGDGITLDPEKYLTEHMNAILKECNTYEKLSNLAKSNVSINLVPITEDCSYKTRLPYNRYQMLTQYNPLYESTAIISFDNSDENNIDIIYNMGVRKIMKEV